ncbi:MAG: hypothetical protein J7L43_03190 [Candidatus Aenigmarchaeota archaeon]|nr:hypothetical protein [Candidatus Aenigmarchaeota archaeon]
MNAKEYLENVVKKVYKEMDKNCLYFPIIQSEVYTELALEGKSIVESRELFDEKLLYEILKKMSRKYPIKLFSEILSKNEKITISPIIEKKIRYKESLGMALEDLEILDNIEEEIKIDPLCFSCERGYIFVIKNWGKNPVVIKSYQSENEAEISKITDKIGVGPHIYRTGKVWMIEEFVDGKCIAYCDEDVIGKALGQIFGKLHREGILYNDGPIRHTILNNERTKLIDYGISTFGTNFDKDIKHILDYFHIEDLRDAKKEFIKSYKNSFS